MTTETLDEQATPGSWVALREVQDPETEHIIWVRAIKRGWLLGLLLDHGWEDPRWIMKACDIHSLVPVVGLAPPMPADLNWGSLR